MRSGDEGVLELKGSRCASVDGRNDDCLVELHRSSPSLNPLDLRLTELPFALYHVV